MIPGSTHQAIFHLHPLRRCNLACLHCYSNSSPYAKAILSLEECLAAIRQASAWGYSVLSISGGEPLLYPWLEELLKEAIYVGMKISLVTNGLLLNRTKNLKILSLVDTLAVSIDGMADNHDFLRGRVGTYMEVQHALSILADNGIRYAISCSVTSHNIDELECLTEIAWKNGAIGIQFHPIELAGRAANNCSLALTQIEANIFFITATLLAKEHANRLSIHFDVMHRDWLLSCPEIVYAHPLEDDLKTLLPSNLIGVLALDPDGELCPVSYGFAPLYRLGNIRKASIGDLWPSYLLDGYLKLRLLGKNVYNDIKNGGDTILNPNELLVKGSYSLLE